MPRTEYVCMECGNFSYTQNGNPKRMEKTLPLDSLFPGFSVPYIPKPKPHKSNLCKADGCSGKLEEIVVLGATRLDSFLKCPKYFEYSHILGEKAPATIYLAFGKMMHRFCEAFYWTNYKSSESFAGQFVGRWFGKVMEGKDKRIGFVSVYDESKRTDIFGAYSGIGRNVLSAFWNRHIGRRKEIEIIRKEKLAEFESQRKAQRKGNRGKWKLPAKERKVFFKSLDMFPKTEFGFLTSWTDSSGRIHYLRGSIDRIDQVKDGYVISDYKSGKKASNQQNDLLLKEKPHQFTIYSIVTEKLFGERPKGVFLYSLQSNEVQPIKISSTHIVTLEEDLAKAEEAIKAKSFPKRMGHHCASCDFHRLCLSSKESACSERTVEEIEKDREDFWAEVEISSEGI